MDEKDKNITVDGIRAMAKQIKGAQVGTSISMPMRDDIVLTVAGVVYIPEVGYMHPKTFTDILGEDAYKILLRRPRVVCEYDNLNPDDWPEFQK